MYEMKIINVSATACKPAGGANTNEEERVNA